MRPWSARRTPPLSYPVRSVRSCAYQKMTRWCGCEPRRAKTWKPSRFRKRPWKRPNARRSCAPSTAELTAPARSTPAPAAALTNGGDATSRLWAENRRLAGDVADLIADMLKGDEDS